MQLKHLITSITPTSVTCTVGGRETSVQADSVVVALGMVANSKLYDEIRANLATEVIPVGDAVRARKVINAVHEGYHAARRI